MKLGRRQLIGAGLGASALLATSKFRVVEAVSLENDGKLDSAFVELDAFIESYMRQMNAPGMTLVIADRTGVLRVATYGLGNVEQQQPIEAQQLFHIGSISKSFLALVLMQLVDEGKLNLHRPIQEYLPWLRLESTFRPVNTHDLLTHSSGLPGAAPVFLPNPGDAHKVAYAPGDRFQYNNFGFSLLGILAWTLDGRELPEILHERILAPLGMNQSEPAITFGMRERTVRNYWPFLADRYLPRFGALVEAPAVISTDGAGCIAASAGDMGLYVQMLLNRGAGAQGRLVSKSSFESFASKQIEAKAYGDQAGYGYGMVVVPSGDSVKLSHTGGTTSFMSSLAADLGAGVGAFASINAQQEYRPTPVIEYAIQLVLATRKNLPSPKVPIIPSAVEFPGAAEFAGSFEDEAGRSIEFEAIDNHLFLLDDSRQIAMERGPGQDSFIAQDDELRTFPFVFERRLDCHSSQSDAPCPVAEVSWGNHWYRNKLYRGPDKFSCPQDWHAYAGHYRNEDPWRGSVRIALRKGILYWLGSTPIEPVDELFRFTSQPDSTDWIQFGEIVNGRCMRIWFSGNEFRRAFVS